MYHDVVITIRGNNLLQHRYIGDQPSMEKPPKGKKTEAYIDSLHKKDWMQAAYFANGMFHMPPEIVEAALVGGAKRNRKGEDFKRGCMVVEDFIPLIYFTDQNDKKGHYLEGNLEDFYKPEFIDLRGVRVGTARVDRCRPIFRCWGLQFTLRYDDELLSIRDIESAVKNMAIGDFRPRFGKVTDFKIGKPVALADVA